MNEGSPGRRQPLNPFNPDLNENTDWLVIVNLAYSSHYLYPGRFEYSLEGGRGATR